MKNDSELQVVRVIVQSVIRIDEKFSNSDVSICERQIQRQCLPPTRHGFPSCQGNLAPGAHMALQGRTRNHSYLVTLLEKKYQTELERL